MIRKKFDQKSEKFEQQDFKVSDEYFQKKYFDQPEFRSKKLEEDDPFEVTVKLYKEHRDTIEKKKEDYVAYRSYDKGLYYEPIEIEYKLQKQPKSL